MGSFTATASNWLQCLEPQALVVLTGVGTSWTNETVFSVAGVGDVAIASQVVASAAAAQLLLSIGRYHGVLTISDGALTATITIHGDEGLEVAQERAYDSANRGPLPSPLVPLFNGQPLFGDPPSFTSAPLTGGAAGVDEFLGFTPGTTLYSEGPGGRGWGIAGTFRGPTAAAVTAQAATLWSSAGIRAPFGRPTGARFPGNFETWPNCEFLFTELVTNPTGVLLSAGNMYVLTYLLVIRQRSIE